jgi:protein-S-isoprenylcysteine O-methyltransferase Ste14
MWAGSPAPSVVAMTKEPSQRRRQDGGPVTVVVGVLAAVALAVLIARLAGWARFDFHPLDLDPPGWLRWLGPVLGVGKLVFLVGLGLLAALGAWERRRRRDEGPS